MTRLMHFRTVPPVGWPWSVVGAALVLATGCGGGGSDEPDTPAATVQEGEVGEEAEASSGTTTATTDRPEPTTTTIAPTPEQEVEQAYLRSWEVYAEAVKELDEGVLTRAYGGEALAAVVREVDRLQAANTPLVVDVDHDYELRMTGPSSAVVVDEYVNRNYRVDRSTGEPIDPPNDPGIYVESYQLREVDGSWKVIVILRESSP